MKRDKSEIPKDFKKWRKENMHLLKCVHTSGGIGNLCRELKKAKLED